MNVMQMIEYTEIALMVDTFGTLADMLCVTYISVLIVIKPLHSPIKYCVQISDFFI